MKGIIAGRSPGIPSGKTREIQDIPDGPPVLSEKMIALLQWMSHYYMAEQGLILNSMLPKEAFTRVKKRKPHVVSHVPAGTAVSRMPALNTPEVHMPHLANVAKSLNKDSYKTFLLHASSSAYEYAFLLKLTSETTNIIILVPEVSLIHNLSRLLNQAFGERVCLFHSELSRGQRSESIDRILSGRSDIVLGTRSAVFAPLKNVSCIAVLREHSSSYKQGKTPCYNARDIAVMRGSLEKAVVLLSSISPSIESYYNCESGKYTLLKLYSSLKKPRITVIDMKYRKASVPSLSRTILDAASKQIKNNNKIMFVVSRRGYATLLQCIDCSHIEECPSCSIPLVFHKHDMSMKCHYCGYTLRQAPENCSRCKSYHMQLLGSGTQRIQEEIEDLLQIQTLRLDSDRAQKKSEREQLTTSPFGEMNRVLIGTKLMTKRLGSEIRFSMAAIIHVDLYLHLPDFRAAEKAYQEILAVTDRVEPGGEIFIQTRMPENYLFRSLRHYDYNAFFREELKRRKALRYPPYAKLILIHCMTKKDISKKLLPILHADDDLEILGPSLSKNKKGETIYKVLLKSAVRHKLHSAAESIMHSLEDFKDVIIRADVDPIVI
jgi:primosomal protein N' (replication factor Y)